jgi:uncharacterized protein YegP (UPF0339 family)
MLSRYENLNVCRQGASSVKLSLPKPIVLAAEGLAKLSTPSKRFSIMAKFVIRKNAAGSYWFVLKKTVLQSQMYTTKQHAETGIHAIKSEAAAATVDDQTATNHSGHETVENYNNN